jgi:hypothetical protein
LKAKLVRKNGTGSTKWGKMSSLRISCGDPILIGLFGCFICLSSCREPVSLSQSFKAISWQSTKSSSKSQPQNNFGPKSINNGQQNIGTAENSDKSHWRSNKRKKDEHIWEQNEKKRFENI